MASKLKIYFLLLLIWIVTVCATGTIRRDEWTKALILGYVYQGVKVGTVAKAFGISARTIRRWKFKYETYGTIFYEPKRGGPHDQITRNHVRIIIQLLRRKPHAYIWEIKQDLYRRTGDDFSISAIWKKCKDNKYTHKVLTRRFSEANPYVELGFWAGLSRHNIHINQLVWIDESYLCRTSGNRTRGWGLRHVHRSIHIISIYI